LGGLLLKKTVVRHKDILDTALALGGYFTFCNAVEAADLTGTLRSFGPYTVFAPTDAAFKKLGASIVPDLLKPKNKNALARVIRYHIAPGILTAEEIASSSEIPTLCGEPLVVTLRPGKTMIDTAIIVAADIQCRNGMIHGIDAVMLPRK
jgi:uncharacterized surface protein with fasciclin (FAS1) repeats